jgi:hypothetical protein
MIDPQAVPEPSAPVEHHADFLELCVLRSHQRSVSFQEFARDMRMTGATETLLDSEQPDGGDHVDDRTEGLVEAAFAELDHRRRSCGNLAGSYPFDFSADGNRLTAHEGYAESLYTFLALLSWFGKDAGPRGSDGEKLFEEVAASASEVYLGGPGHRVHSYVFGFPRRVGPSGFAQALDELCRKLGEGRGHHSGRPMLPDQKDGKLDVVAWVDFTDAREGKLIAFGQCATGSNWKQKISELPSPDLWCAQWMAETPTVLPIRCFFVPHRVEAQRWIFSCRFGGILYDRCRIASLASAIGDTLQRRLVEWSGHVLNGIRNSA